MHICHFYICIPCNRFCLWLHIQDITADSNKKISVDKKASAIKENAPPAVTNAASVVENENVSVVEVNDSETVYRTRTGKKYHKENCSYLKSKIETTVSEAISMGLEPCSRCFVR